MIVELPSCLENILFSNFLVHVSYSYDPIAIKSANMQRLPDCSLAHVNLFPSFALPQPSLHIYVTGFTIGWIRKH